MPSYFSFQWHLTDQCDQRCKHCYIFSENTTKPLDEMSWSLIQTTLNNCRQFCDHFGRTPYFYITGGDPILHPEWWRLADQLHDLGIAYSLMGNPFHLTPDVCARLMSTGCQKYQMSLDGLEPTHDWFRKPGSYRATMNAIGMLREADIRAVIMTTVSGVNIDQIPQLIDEVVAHHADVYAFARYCPTSAEKDTHITPARYRQLLLDCDRKFRNYEAAGCSTYFNRKDHLWTLLDYELGRFHIPADAQEGMIYGGCNCGNAHLTILPTGDVYACRRVMNSRVGNVATDSLVDLWLGPMEAYRHFDRFAKCKDCELLAWCRGCPAVAAGKTQDFYATDPQCWHEYTRDH